jgi:hypothetical protein
MNAKGRIPDHEPALTAFKCGNNFPEKVSAQLFYSDEQYNYYKWTLPNH